MKTDKLRDNLIEFLQFKSKIFAITLFENEHELADDFIAKYGDSFKHPLKSEFKCENPFHNIEINEEAICNKCGMGKLKT